MAPDIQERKASPAVAERAEALVQDTHIPEVVEAEHTHMGMQVGMGTPVVVERIHTLVAVGKQPAVVAYTAQVAEAEERS